MRFADLQRSHDELRLTNTDLKRQIEKWQTLETKGNNELEALRNQRIEGQVKLKESEERWHEREMELERALEKKERALAKYKESVDEWQVGCRLRWRYQVH